MQLVPSLLALSCALSLASAHFEVKEPPVRGYDGEKVVNFPCGGQSVSSKRYEVSVENPELSIVMAMGHDQAAVQVLLGLGSDPGTNYNVTLVPTMREQGLGDFCLPGISLSEDVLGAEIEDGMNATVQVVTNGDPSGGLYNVSISNCLLQFWDIPLTGPSSASTSPSPPTQRAKSPILAPMAPESARSFSRATLLAATQTSQGPMASPRVGAEATMATTNRPKTARLCRCKRLHGVCLVLSLRAASHCCRQIEMLLSMSAVTTCTT